MKYSQDEINQILLTKSLNEFYLATIENRGELLTDEEYAKILRSNKVYTEATQENIDDLSKKIQGNEKLKEFAPELMKMIYSLASVRYVGILTMIGDEVYDIANAEFADLKRNKIVHYDNFANYYDETNARLKFVTPEEEPQLKQKTVLIDVDNEEIVYEYEQVHVNQKESEDLTSSFFATIKNKPHTLTRKYNNN